MKLPEHIISRANKVRDARICMRYIQGETPEEIKQSCNLKISVRRIWQIIYANSGYITKHIGWDKAQRIQKAQKLFDQTKDKLSVLEYVRKELEGDKPIVDQSIKHTQIIYSWGEAPEGSNESTQQNARLEQV